MSETQYVYMQINGEFYPLGKKNITLDVGSSVSGTLRDGRRVYVKNGRWVYVPTGTE